MRIPVASLLVRRQETHDHVWRLRDADRRLVPHLMQPSADGGEEGSGPAVHCRHQHHTHDPHDCQAAQAVGCPASDVIGRPDPDTDECDRADGHPGTPPPKQEGGYQHACTPGQHDGGDGR